MQDAEPMSTLIAAGTPPIVVEPVLLRIEKLTLKCLGRQLKSPQDLWQFQLDLLHLQRDIQAAINICKDQVRQGKVSADSLTDLRACRWNAKRLGDALAWAMLGRNTKIIEPLSRNSRTPINPLSNHGSRGMLAMASHLANQGWGFPLLHDITDCLRIGDITFVRVEGNERRHHTAEVKTRAQFKGRIEPGNLARYEYQIQAIFPASPDDPAPELKELITPITFSPPPSNSRTARQAKRISTAFLHQTATPNVLLRDGGDVPVLWTTVTTTTAAHWRSLQRTVRKARRNGYGSECVDDAFLYVAIYDADGISSDSTKYHTNLLQEDLSNPALLMRDADAVNVLSIAQVPPAEQVNPHLFLPYYLYPIPRTSICDILHGRMIILVFFNVGRFADSLKENGFDVSFDQRAENSPLTVSRSMTADSGNEYYVQSPDLRSYLDEIIYEFRSRDSIVAAAEAVMDAAVSAATELVREKESEVISDSSRATGSGS
jgi:hypothetical protein